MKGKACKWRSELTKSSTLQVYLLSIRLKVGSLMCSITMTVMNDLTAHPYESTNRSRFIPPLGPHLWFSTERQLTANTKSHWVLLSGKSIFKVFCVSVEEEADYLPVAIKWLIGLVISILSAAIINSFVSPEICNSEYIYATSRIISQSIVPKGESEYWRNLDWEQRGLLLMTDKRRFGRGSCMQELLTGSFKVEQFLAIPGPSFLCTKESCLDVIS